MLKVIQGYLPKNKFLTRLGRKARLELVLRGVISPQTLSEIGASVSCWNCKWYVPKMAVLHQFSYSCTKPGIKKTKQFGVMVDMGSKFNIIKKLPYCDGFEEKEDI